VTHHPSQFRTKLRTLLCLQEKHCLPS